VRFIWANIGAFHVCLWTFTLTEAWAWGRQDEELVDRSGSPWDSPSRRPSHADKRRAWRRALLGEEIRAVLRLGMTEGEIQATAERLLKLPDGSLQVLLQGAARIRLAQTASQTEPYLRCDIEPLPSTVVDPVSLQTQGLVKNLQSLFQRVVALSPVLPEEMGTAAANVDDPGRLADFVASSLELDDGEAQAILATVDPGDRLQRINIILARELDVLELQSQIHSKVQEGVSYTHLTLPTIYAVYISGGGVNFINKHTYIQFFVCNV